MIPNLCEEKAGVTLIVSNEQKSPFKQLFKRLILSLLFFSTITFVILHPEKMHPTFMELLYILIVL